MLWLQWSCCEMSSPLSVAGISIRSVVNSSDVILYLTLSHFWRGWFFICFPLCLSKPHPKEDQLAESSNLKQGDYLQKRMWACLLFSTPFCVSLWMRLFDHRWHSLNENYMFVTSGSNRYRQSNDMKWDGMSFELHWDVYVIKAWSMEKLAMSQAGCGVWRCQHVWSMWLVASFHNLLTWLLKEKRLNLVSDVCLTWLIGNCRKPICHNVTSAHPTKV